MGRTSTDAPAATCLRMASGCATAGIMTSAQIQMKALKC